MSRTPRNQVLLDGLQTDRLLGVEIGPLDRPIITREMGRVLYVDHADTESLRAKYADDPGVRASAIMEIDAVWDEEGLDPLVRRHGPVDYVVASHVIEHVPDLIGWLQAAGRALSPAGEIRLVVPDKRFCFDHHRAESTLADLLAARAAGERRPPVARIADYFLHVVDVEAADVWAGRPPPPPVIDAGRYRWAEGVCREVRASGRYQDVHCWVFTPRRFCLLLADLVAFGALELECTMFRDTERDGLEFLVGMRRCGDPVRAEASWREAAARAVAAPDTARAAPTRGRRRWRLVARPSRQQPARD
jgi:SAM-dependent methyltransferase